MSKKEGNWFNRHKVLTVILVLVVIGVAVSASSGNSNSSNTQSNNQTSSGGNNKPTVARVGQPARDGQFEFVVKGIKCGKPSVVDSTGYVTKNAQGQYCLMTLSVKNIGDKQQLFSESDQKLLNQSNQQFSPDTEATLTNSSSQTDPFLSQINPGNSVEGVLVFDVPKGQIMTKAELHDSSLSNGVEVSLQ